MRKRLLAAAVGFAALTSAAATDASARIDSRTDSSTVVPGSTVTVDLAALLRDDAKRQQTARGLSFQDLFLDARSRAGISSATVNPDDTITIRFAPGFTDTTRFRYAAAGRTALGGQREFSRGDTIFRVARPS